MPRFANAYSWDSSIPLVSSTPASGANFGTGNQIGDSTTRTALVKLYAKSSDAPMLVRPQALERAAIRSERTVARLHPKSSAGLHLQMCDVNSQRIESPSEITIDALAVQAAVHADVFDFIPVGVKPESSRSPGWPAI